MKREKKKNSTTICNYVEYDEITSGGKIWKRI